MFERRLLRAVLLLFAMLSPVLAPAQSEPGSKDREMLRRTQLELRKLQQQNAALKSDNSKLEADLKATQAQAAGREDELAAVRRQGGALQAEVSKLPSGERALQQSLQQSADEAARKLAQAEQTLAQRDAEIVGLKDAVQDATARGESCEAKNVQLYEYGQTLLLQYRDKGVWDSLRQQEPVLGLHQVQIENTLEEYRDKLAAQRVAAPQAP